MENCDYSFGSITVGNTKSANLSNSEFIQKYMGIKNDGRSFMTLYIDNIRLYRRPSGGIQYNNMENPGTNNWEEHRKLKDKLILENKDQDLLELCSKLKDMNFIIFTGLEDTNIDNEIFNLIPSNVLSIYASSSRSFGGKVIPIPFGLMYENSGQRADALKNLIKLEISPSNKVYINHSLGSNSERPLINKMFSNYNWVTISIPKSTSVEDYISYLKEIKNHKFVICSDGNAIDCDCYRNWETLYMRRVPICKRSPYLEKIFEGLPVLFVDKFEDVTEDLIDSNDHLYQEAQTFDMSLLDIEIMFKNIISKYKYLDIVKWIKDYASNKFKLVVGISGGIDSALVSTLCAMTGIETYVISLPIHQNESQISNAKNHIKWLKSKYDNVIDFEFDLTNLFDSFERIFTSVNCDKCHHPLFDSKLSLANSRSRLRMTSLYQISSNVNGIVVGTGNKVEDFGIGFFTKYGDGGVDISPIADLTKTEVRKMAISVGIIDDILKAKPTDGLWEDNRSDEDQIGATYEELEWAMSYIESNKLIHSEELSSREKEVLNIYSVLHGKNKHKMVDIPIFKNNNKI